METVKRLTKEIPRGAKAEASLLAAWPLPTVLWLPVAAGTPARASCEYRRFHVQNPFLHELDATGVGITRQLWTMQRPCNPLDRLWVLKSSSGRLKSRACCLGLQRACQAFLGECPPAYQGRQSRLAALNR